MGSEKRARPAPELGTGKSRDRRMVPLCKWASPRSFKLVKDSVVKSNLVASEKRRKWMKRRRRRREEGIV